MRIKNGFQMLFLLYFWLFLLFLYFWLIIFHLHFAERSNFLAGDPDFSNIKTDNLDEIFEAQKSHADPAQRMITS